MPRYYCDYCDTFLTHDSPSVRKTHNAGRKHKDAVRQYYQEWMENQAQRLVDATTKAFKEGKIPPNQMMPGFRPPGGAMVPPPPGLGGKPGQVPPQFMMRPGMPGMPGMPMMPMMMMPGMRPGMPMGMMPMAGRPTGPPGQQQPGMPGGAPAIKTE